MLQTHSLIRLSDLVNYSSFTQFCQLFDYQVLGLDYYISHSKTVKSVWIQVSIIRGQNTYEHKSHRKHPLRSTTVLWGSSRNRVLWNVVAGRYVISNSTAKFKHKRHQAAQTNGLLRSWNVTDSWSDTEDRPGIWRTTLRSGKSLPHNSAPLNTSN
jgi:hypothetical protein